MALISADFFPQSLSFGTQHKPTSHFSCNFISSCTKPHRNPLCAKISAVSVNVQTNSESSEKEKQTHLLKGLHESLNAQKYSESLRFLENLVSMGSQFRPDLSLCKEIVNRFLYSYSGQYGIGEATKALQILELYGEADASAYIYVMKGYCNLNLMVSAIQLLNRMRKQRVPGIVDMYNLIIRSLCRKGKLELVLKILDQFCKDNCTPNAFTYNTLINTCASRGRWSGAMKLLDEMVSRGLEPGPGSYYKIIEGMCMDGQVDQALDLLKNLPSKGCKLHLSYYNLLLSGLLEYGRWKEAEKLFKEMLSRKIKPNEVTYGILITSLCRDGMIDEATCLSKLMMEKGLQPNIYIVSQVISMYCREGVLEKMGHSLDANEYNVMITALCKKEDTIGVLRTVLDMIDNGIDLCYATYKSLISCLIKARMVDEAMGLFKVMEISDITPTVFTYNSVIAGLCRACRVDDAIQVLEVMVEKGCLPNEITYIVLIEAIHSEGYQLEALELANFLVLMGVISKEKLARFQENFPITETVDSSLVQTQEAP